MPLIAEGSCVFFGNSQSVFVSRTSQNLTESGLDVSIVDISKPLIWKNGKKIPPLARILARIVHVWSDILRVKKRETAVIHSLTPHVIWLAPLLNLYFNRVCLICYGSDVLRRNKSLDLLLGIGLRFIDRFAFTNVNVLNEMQSSFSFLTHRNFQILRFGLPVLEVLETSHVTKRDAKIQLGLSPESICVALGYASTPGQRQRELIDYFLKKTKKLKKFQFIIPCQYGDVAEIEKVKKILKSHQMSLEKNNFIVFDEFFCEEKTALMRKAVDILINHSVSDSFSGTVQESIYAGNLILAADHLPYFSMPGADSAIKFYKNLEELDILLSENNIVNWGQKVRESLPHVRNQIYNMSAWPSLLNEWNQFLFGRD